MEDKRVFVDRDADRRNGWSWFIIPLIIGLLLGGLIMYFLKNNVLKTDSTNTNTQAQNLGDSNVKTDNSAADLRVALNNLLRSHVGQSLALARTAYDGSVENGEINALSENNTNTLVQIIGKYYGDDNKAKFTDMWKMHIMLYQNYGKAVKAADTAGIAKAKADLATAAEDMSTFLSTINTNLNKEAVKGVLSDHAALITAGVDAYAKNDLNTLYSKENEGEDQIAKLADTLAAAIVKQFSDKF